MIDAADIDKMLDSGLPVIFNSAEDDGVVTLVKVDNHWISSVCYSDTTGEIFIVHDHKKDGWVFDREEDIQNV